MIEGGNRKILLRFKSKSKLYLNHISKEQSNREKNDSLDPDILFTVQPTRFSINNVSVLDTLLKQATAYATTRHALSPLPSPFGISSQTALSFLYFVVLFCCLLLFAVGASFWFGEINQKFILLKTRINQLSATWIFEKPSPSERQIERRSLTEFHPKSGQSNDAIDSKNAHVACCVVKGVTRARSRYSHSHTVQWQARANDWVAIGFVAI